MESAVRLASLGMSPGGAGAAGGALERWRDCCARRGAPWITPAANTREARSSRVSRGAATGGGSCSGGGAMPAAVTERAELLPSALPCGRRLAGTGVTVLEEPAAVASGGATKRSYEALGGATGIRVAVRACLEAGGPGLDTSPRTRTERLACTSSAADGSCGVRGGGTGVSPADEAADVSCARRGAVHRRSDASFVRGSTGVPCVPGASSAEETGASRAARAPCTTL